VSVGDTAWAVIAAAWLCWLVVSSTWSRVPSITDFGRSLLGSWLGRYVALAAWAGVGWHLFCQRP
jgi:hypothetical protein